MRSCGFKGGRDHVAVLNIERRILEMEGALGDDFKEKLLNASCKGAHDL